MERSFANVMLSSRFPGYNVSTHTITRHSSLSFSNSYYEIPSNIFFKKRIAFTECNDVKYRFFFLVTQSCLPLTAQGWFLFLLNFSLPIAHSHIFSMSLILYFFFIFLFKCWFFFCCFDEFITQYTPLKSCLIW